MHAFHRFIIVNMFTIGCASAAMAAEAGGPLPAPAEPPSVAESHGFDFEFGDWLVSHRVKRPDGSWLTFDGTCTTRPLAGGLGNVEEHVFNKASGVTRGVAIRAFRPDTKEWAIWWIDGRNPHGALDPPVIGRFENGTGTFTSEGPLNGKIIRTRYLWSQITKTSARWEQASSDDSGKTWDTNWIMVFQRKE